MTRFAYTHDEFPTPMPRSQVVGTLVSLDQRTGEMDGRAYPSQEQQQREIIANNHSKDSREVT